MRERKTRKLVMYGLIVALMATTVAYAVLQTTLNINGTVTKKGGSWNIYFTNLSTPSRASGTLTGEASVSNPNLSATSFTFEATIVKPLDSIVYTFDVVNDGTIDAELDSITLTGVDEAKTKDITYTLTYADGKAIAKGDALASEETKTLKLTLSYDDVDTLDSEDTTLDIGATLVYVQASDELVEEIDGYKVAVALVTETTNTGTVTLVKEGTDVAFVSPKVVRLGSNAMLADNETNSYPMTYNELTKKYEAVVPEAGTYSIVAEAKNHLPYTATSINVDSHKDLTIKLIAGDIDGNGTVDVYDLGDLLKVYHTYNAEVDITGDGYVDFLDKTILLSNYGKTSGVTEEETPIEAVKGAVSFDFNIEEGVTVDTEESVYKLVVSLSDSIGAIKVFQNTLEFDNELIIPVNYSDGTVPDYFNEEIEGAALPILPSKVGTGALKIKFKLPELPIWTMNGKNSKVDIFISWEGAASKVTKPSNLVVYEIYFKLAEGKTIEDITEDSFNVGYIVYFNGAFNYYNHNDESLNTITVNNNVGK